MAAASIPSGPRLGNRELEMLKHATSRGGTKTHEGQHTMARLGLGIEHGCGAWHLFQRVGGNWRLRRKVTIASGYQEKLLLAFLDGGGSLTKQEAIKLWNRHPTPTDVAGFLQRVKTELAVIRKRIRAEVGASGQSANPVWFDEHQKWRLAISIGVATQEDGNYCGGESRLRFKTKSSSLPRN